MGTAREQAEGLVEKIKAGGILRATRDPKQAAANRPTCLVPPPKVDWTRGTYAGPELTWQLVLLSSHAAGSIEAFDQLDHLLDKLADLVDVERAEPAQYPLAPDTPAVPCYVVTTTT